MKKIMSIGIIGMFLLTSITVLSAVVEEESVSAGTAQVYGEQTTGTARVYGYVTTLLGRPIDGARVWIETFIENFPTCWCNHYENEYYTGSDGSYEFTGVPNNDLLDSGHCVYEFGVTKAGYYMALPVFTLGYIPSNDASVRIDFKLIKNPFDSNTQSSQSTPLSTPSSQPTNR